MRRGRGFTLIEVLIAITLLAVIVTVGFAVLRTCLRGWDVGEAHLDAIEQRATTIGVLRNYLANAIPIQDEPTGVGVLARPVLHFVGSPQSIRFAAFPPDQAGRGRLYDFLLYAENGSLLAAMMPYGKPLLTPVEAEKVSLLDKISNIRFAYFGSDWDKPNRPYWRVSWQQPLFPELIGIHIEDSLGVLEMEIALRGGNPL